MSLVKTYTFITDTTILPDEVNQNFNEIVSYINSNVALLEGAAFTGGVVLPAGDPATINSAARKQYVDDKVSVAQAAAISSANGTSAAALAAKALLVPYINAGVGSGTTNGSGDITFAHGMTSTPLFAAVSLINDGGSGVGQLTATLTDLGATTCTFRFCTASTGIGLAGAGLTFRWIAYVGHGV